MKTIYTLILILLITFSNFSSILSKEILGNPDHFVETKFKVYGNCEMCKIRIEKSLEVTGVKEASWNVASKVITVNYNPHEITLNEIHAIIAKKGYDTEMVKASDYIYNRLPKCCQYKRSEVIIKKDSVERK